MIPAGSDKHQELYSQSMSPANDVAPFPQRSQEVQSCYWPGEGRTGCIWHIALLIPKRPRENRSDGKRKSQLTVGTGRNCGRRRGGGGDLYHKQSSLLESCNRDSLGDC